MLTKTEGIWNILVSTCDRFEWSSNSSNSSCKALILLWSAELRTPQARTALRFAESQSQTRLLTQNSLKRKPSLTSLSLNNKMKYQNTELIQVAATLRCPARSTAFHLSPWSVRWAGSLGIDEVLCLAAAERRDSLLGPRPRSNSTEKPTSKQASKVWFDVALEFQGLSSPRHASKRQLTLHRIQSEFNQSCRSETSHSMGSASIALRRTARGQWRRLPFCSPRNECVCDRSVLRGS